MGGGDDKCCSVGISHCSVWIEDQEASDVVLTVLDVAFENGHIV